MTVRVDGTGAKDVGVHAHVCVALYRLGVFREPSSDVVRRGAEHTSFGGASDGAGEEGASHHQVRQACPPVAPVAQEEPQSPGFEADPINAGAVTPEQIWLALGPLGSRPPACRAVSLRPGTQARVWVCGEGVEDGGEASQAASSNNVISIAKNGAARKNIVAFPTATHSLP